MLIYFLVVALVCVVGLCVYFQIKSHKTSQAQKRANPTRNKPSIRDFETNTKKFMALCGKTGDDIEYLTPLTALASIIIVAPLDRSLRNTTFNNKYVRADAAILLTLYSLKKFSASNIYFSNKSKEELYSYVSTGILKMYNFNEIELNEIKENRIPYFEEYLQKVYPNIDSFIDEATLLLDYDVTYNRFVEFKNNSPIIVHNDFYEHMAFERQVKLYFNGLIELIDNHILNPDYISN